MKKFICLFNRSMLVLIAVYIIQTHIAAADSHDSLVDSTKVENWIANKKYDRVQTYLMSALERPMDDFKSFKLSIDMLIKADRMNMASKILSETITKFPDQPDLHAQRGVIYLMQGKYESTIDEFTKELAINPKNISVLKIRVTCYLNLKLYNEAIHDYTKLMEFEPQNLQWLQERADTYYRMEKYAEAIEDYDKLLRLDETNEYAQMGLKFSHEKLFDDE